MSCLCDVLPKGWKPGAGGSKPWAHALPCSSLLYPEEGKSSLDRDEAGMVAHAYNPFMRQRQEDCCKLEDNLGYIVSSRQKPSLPK